MIVGRRLHPINHLAQIMSHPQSFSLTQKLSESLMIVAKNKSPQKRLPRRCPEKGIVLIFCYIHPYDQTLLRMPYLFPQLTKFFQPATIQFIHKKPPFKNLSLVVLTLIS